MKTIEYEGAWCFTIDEAAEALVKQANKKACIVQTDFNGIIIQGIPGGGDAKLIVEYYRARCEESGARYRAKSLAHQNTPEGQEELRIAKKKNEKIKATLAEPMKTFKLKDKAAWDKSVTANKDPYGNAGITFAARWAWTMEQEIAKGKQLADIAKQASHDADIEGITGFMYGCAVSVLSQVWEHGEELRIWHNKDAQINDEGDKANESGGVINPALVNIGQ